MFRRILRRLPMNNIYLSSAAGAVVKVNAVNITAFPAHQVEALIRRTGNEKAARFVFEEDRFRSLAGELLARTMIAETLGVSQADLVFTRNRYGKPFLLQPTSTLEFNISHAGTWVVAAVSTQAIGIDVERTAPIDPELARRFFSGEEYQLIRNQPSEEQTIAKFYEIWTYKESYIKAVGKGLSIPLDSFTTVVNGELIQQLSAGERDWYFTPLCWDNGYYATVCSTLPICGCTVETLDIEVLVETFLS
ncbi:4'-phosphopantetheinyl transferase family protein [Paenibacillus caui]|uniref:4'-phosphopantetheinyl transferase family protein n=1 Tax=Paenibacillus caui TaxID=2873927 RepID=UPI001CA961D7|nr:4'-phosphopantetheinyl transferase superfamily protein [Paenibacillus caui]